MIVKIDMPEFQRYIKLMNDMVENMVDANKTMAQVIEAAETEWYDDIYKDARNQIFDMQPLTNGFIERLEALDEDLVKWYCKLYEKYACVTDYVRPRVDMRRTEIKSGEIMKNDERFRVSKNALENYVSAAKKYTAEIRGELDSFQTHNTQFAEHFQTRRYEEITNTLIPIIKDMRNLLNEIDGLAGFVENKIETIWEFDN